MAFPTHGIRQTSTYSLEPKRKTIISQAGKPRGKVFRASAYRIFLLYTVFLTDAEVQEWDDHYNTLNPNGVEDSSTSDTITIDGDSYTCFYMGKPTARQVKGAPPGQREVVVKLWEDA